MAAVIGDFAAEPARYYNMIATSGIHHQHSHDSSPYRSGSRSRDAARRSSASPRRQRPRAVSSARYQSEDEPAGEDDRPAPSTTGGASRFPSPPSSSSPGASSGPPHPENGSSPPAHMETESHDPRRAGHAPTPSRQQPSPASDNFVLSGSTDAYHAASTSSPPPPASQTTIRVRDLAHIQSLARADMVTGNGPGILNDPPLQQMKYEISGMPIGDIIEMVAALLTKITTTNDLQHDAMQRNVAHQQQANQPGDAASSQMSPLSTSVLAFHGKNVPAITILSYLSRIHKYCPTTYEVFLSLLVYFDRMTERVNDMVMKNEEVKRLAALHPPPAPTQDVPDEDAIMKDEAAESDETDSDLADDDDEVERGPRERRNTELSGEGSGTVVTGVGAPTTASGPATYFVVDSFNIHRLIIAGVTCASKFFSDVFYTNSRYAKVGGLPLPELNHLELQFLLLNDFRLAVPVEDLEAYATMLVEFYAREVVAQRSRPALGME